MVDFSISRAFSSFSAIFSASSSFCSRNSCRKKQNREQQQGGAGRRGKVKETEGGDDGVRTMGGT